MTSPERTPEQSRPNGLKEIFDLWVSRRIDGEATPEDIPEGIRDDVEQRVPVASQLRHTLLRSQSMIGFDARTRDAQIAHAMTRLGPVGGSRFTVSRAVFGLAASFVVVLGLSVVITQQSDDRNEAIGADPVVAESMSSPVEEPSKDLSLPDVSVSLDLQRSDQAASSVDDQMSSIATPDSIGASSLPQFDTIEEMTDFVARLDPLRPMTEGLNASPVEPCVKSSAQAIQEVLFLGRRVQVHIFAPGVFQIFETETCSLLAEREAVR
jgi:hypothetical protein